MLFKKPLEVKLSITGRCNYSCDFCFNRNLSQSPKELSARDARKTIKGIADAGIEKVRFTGGEPLLRPDIFGLMEYAKRLGLFVMLNTNGSLLGEKTVSRLRACCDDILVSLNAANASDEARLSGRKGKGLFAAKLSGLKALSQESLFVRASTILSRRNIQKLQEFSGLADSLSVKQWLLLRPIPNPGMPFPLDSAGVENAVEAIISINRGKKEKTLIENAIPFCSYEPKKVSAVALGAIHEDGNSSLAVDASGTIRPSYFIDLALGSALKGEFIAAWEHAFMQRLHSLEFIDEPCHKCIYLHKCRGGSRFSALFSNRSLYAPDPLANPSKFQKKLFLPGRPCRNDL